MGDVTVILDAVDAGDPQAAEKLLPLIYEELRQLAAAKMAAEKPGHTLQATALVHEVWLRLMRSSHHSFNDRQHFLAAAAEAMRRILTDRARKKNSLRRGGGEQHLDVEEVDIPWDPPDEKVLAMSEALTALEAKDELKAQVVKLRFFVGLTNLEIAEALDISVATVERHWAYSKGWLMKHIRQHA